MHTKLVHLLLLCAFFYVPANSQVDSIFTKPGNKRVLNFYRIFLESNAADSNTILSKLDTIENTALKNNDEKMQWYARFQKIYMRINWITSIPQRIVKLKEVEPWFKKCPFEELHLSYLFLLGDNYFRNSQFSEGFHYMLKSIEGFERINDKNSPHLQYYYFVIGSYYYDFQDYDKCLYYFKKSEHFEAINPIFSLYVYNGEGMAYSKKQLFNDAETAFEQALAINKIDSVWYGITCGNLGANYLKQGNYAKAIEYLSIDYRINKTTAPENTSYSCLYLTEALLKMGRSEEANFYNKESIRLNTLSADKRHPQDAWFYKQYYRFLAAYYFQKNELGKAYRYQDSAVIMSDSSNEAANILLLSNAEKLIEAEKYRDAIALKEKDLAYSILKRNIILVLAGLGLLFLFYYAYNSRKKAALDKEIFHQKEALMLAEKKAAEEKLAYTETQLNDYIESLKEKSELLEKLKQEVEHSANALGKEEERLEQINALTQLTILTEKEWLKFRKMFETVYPAFIAQVKAMLPWLSPAEMRLICLLRLNLSTNEIASILGIAAESVRKLKYRLRKKIQEENIDFSLDDIGAM